MSPANFFLTSWIYEIGFIGTPGLDDLSFNLDMLGDVPSFVYPNTFIALARWNK